MARAETEWTAETIRAAALRRLARRDKTRPQLRRALERDVARAANPPPEASEWIEEALAYCERLGYLNDRRFAEDLARVMRRKGASARKIQAKLSEKGLSGSWVDEVVGEAGSELVAAIAYARKRRFGRDAERNTKELASLARNGFGYDIARQALQAVREEFEAS